MADKNNPLNTPIAVFESAVPFLARAGLDEEGLRLYRYAVADLKELQADLRRILDRSGDPLHVERLATLALSRLGTLTKKD